MRNHERSFGRSARRARRALIFFIGLLGGLAAFDAVLLFCVLLLVSVLIDPLNPYIGVVMFVAAPAIAVIGAAVAWASYKALHPGRPARAAETRRAAV